MRDPAFYPHPRPSSVEVEETHISLVFIAGDRVYKVKKDIVLPFVDYGTLERRRHFCEEEVRVNRRLAPDVYLGVRSLVAADGGFGLGRADDPQALEYAVEMRRLPRDRVLEQLVPAGAADERLVQAVGHRIADFHRHSDLAPSHFGSADDVKERLDENLRTTLAFVGRWIHSATFSSVERFWDAFVLGNRDLFDERVAGGHVREGHGDLRAEHVVVEEGRVTIFDCVEFDARLRYVDVASDLAFLYMDLERMDAATLANALVRAYVERSGDRQLEQLLPFYASYRAWVRAKAASLRAAQLPEQDPRHSELTAQARALSELAHRMAWRSRLPLAVVVCGVSATGKSTLAAELSRFSGYARSSSDATRKALAGVALGERAPDDAYANGMSDRTYAELARQALAAVESRTGVVIDATYQRARDRRALSEALRSRGARVLFCECRAPAPVLEQRSKVRELAPEAGSDATPGVVRDQLARFEPLDDVPPRDHLIARTDRPLAETLAELDALVSRAVDGGG